MGRRTLGIAFGLLSTAFLAFYLVVRVCFMDALDASVEAAGVHSVGEILANLSPAVGVWLLWAYSFRLGMLLAVIGGAIHSGMGKRGIALLGTAGVVYLATCYL